VSILNNKRRDKTRHACVCVFACVQCRKQKAGSRRQEEEDGGRVE